jgi:hypothetical protein
MPQQWLGDKKKWVSSAATLSNLSNHDSSEAGHDGNK